MRDAVKLLLRGDLAWQGLLLPNLYVVFRREDAWHEYFPNAFAANDCSISLPLFNGMSEVEQDYVIETASTGFEI